MRNLEDNHLYFQKKCSKSELMGTKKMITIGIHGVIGSFTDEALSRLMDELCIKSNRYEVKELIHAKHVIESVVNNKVDYGIFAVANSGSGSYLASVEAMAKYNFKVLALFTMPIDMCILSHSSIRSITEITLFRGHPVAIAQCRRTLKRKWPDILVKPDSDEMDTALSAKMLAQGEIKKTAAIFASKKAAKLYELNILVEGAHDDPLNATSFVFIKK